MNSQENKRQIIAARIKEARRMAGLSQGQVAKMLNLQRPSVSEMESGNRAVSAEELSKLAEIFEVSTSWLLGEGTDRVDPQDDKLQLAARELKKLKQKDLDRLMAILASLKDQEKTS
jgi:transcriptional regulator with XRE-family HTH domain